MNATLVFIHLSYPSPTGEITMFSGRGKIRAAPVKQISIIKLESHVAAKGTKLIGLVRNELEIESTFLMDSTATLG